MLSPWVRIHTFGLVARAEYPRGGLKNEVFGFNLDKRRAHQGGRRKAPRVGRGHGDPDADLDL